MKLKPLLFVVTALTLWHIRTSEAQVRRAPSPSVRQAARLKNYPPATWIRHYLGDDRYKVAGGTWKVVSTQLDNRFHSANCPEMLRQSPNIVIGFISPADAAASGYRPCPVCGGRILGAGALRSGSSLDSRVNSKMSVIDQKWYGFGTVEAAGSTVTKKSYDQRVTLADGVSTVATRQTAVSTTTSRNREGETQTSTSVNVINFRRAALLSKSFGRMFFRADMFQSVNPGAAFQGDVDPDFPPLAKLPDTFSSEEYVVFIRIDLPRGYDVARLLRPSTFPSAYSQFLNTPEMRNAVRTMMPDIMPATLRGLKVTRTVLGGWPGIRLLSVQAQSGGGGSAGGSEQSAPSQEGGGGATQSGHRDRGGGGQSQQEGGAVTNSGSQSTSSLPPMGKNIWIVGTDTPSSKLFIVTASTKGAEVMNSFAARPSRGSRPISAFSLE